MKKPIVFLLLLTLLVSLTSGCGVKGETADADVGAQKKTIADYQTARVGIATGTYSATFLPAMFPDAQMIEYNTIPDMVLALSQGKVDICASDASYYTCMRWEGMQIDRLEEPIETGDYGLVFGKGQNAELREQVNAFIAKIHENGEFDMLQQKWFGNTEPTEFLDPDTLTGTNGTLKIITSVEVKPFAYLKNEKIVGYDIEFLTMFAQEYGYKLDITDVSFPAILLGITQGNYDIGCAGFAITAERAESVDFSAPYHREDVIFMIQGQKGELDAFANANLGVVTGSLYGGYSREQFPNATIQEFNHFADVLMALKQGKVDGTMLDRPNFNSVARTDSKLACVTVPAYSVEIGFGFQKNDGGDALQSQMNAFLEELRAAGEIDALIEKWYGQTEPQETIPLEELADNTKKLKVSIDTTRKPFVYMYNNQPVGFEIEVLYRFCEKYDYSIEIDDVSFASGLAGLASEKYDLVCGGLYMTPERKQSVNFSESYMVADVVLATYAHSGLDNFLSSFRESFEKTFIRENRWKLVGEGILTTLLISVFAVIGGTALGFLLYLGVRSQSELVSKSMAVITRVYSKLIAGTPTLVVLMILFYVIFGKSDLDGVVVAIIGFILTFGSFVFAQLKLTVESVDKGQTEAAYALGYPRNRTFFRIVLPQAMRTFLPTYTGEIVGLIKATSVVGYIAVNDLTKMGDIIRSNTYEAFFPLIAVAVIYFVITWCVTALMELLQKKLDFKNRKDKNILKGVVR